MQEFLVYIHEATDSEVLFKLTLSKPKNKQSQLQNVFVRPISIDNELTWNVTMRYLTNDKTQNLDSKALKKMVKNHLEDSFYNADLFLPSKKITLLQSKKGKLKVLTINENHHIEIEAHNHKKNRLIPESEDFLKDLGISSSNGIVLGHAQDKFKQINRFVELLSALIKEDTHISTIHDMGSGKGYLTFALHNFLSKTTSPNLCTKGIELRDDLVKKCNKIARKNQMDGLSFEQGSIEDYKINRSDMVIALHACDIATDMAISKGLEANAKYIVMAPCCHKQIRKAMRRTDSKLNSLLKYGILKERQAEMLTDTIRALILESQGYEVNIFEFISSEHTGKNVMLTARKTSKKDRNALQKINDLKQEFGIEYHYLETLIK